jgi:thiamine biosynthesis lipoprotein
VAGAVADDHVASEFSSGCGGRLPCASESGDHHSGSRSESALAQQLEDAQIVGVVEAADETVVTSGVYQRYFEKDGTQYHHILDATTGLPARSDIVGVTLKAADGKSADCDALATILLILGEEKAMKMLEETDGFEAFFILEDGTFASTEGMGVTAE